jgi:hypothetical protein
MNKNLRKLGRSLGLVIAFLVAYEGVRVPPLDVLQRARAIAAA